MTGKIAKTSGYYAAFIALGMVVVSIGPILPNLAENTQTKLSQISILFVVRSVGRLLGTCLGGRLYDRIPGHLIMVSVVVIMALAISLVPLIPSLWILAALLLIMGLATGTLDVGGNTLLVWVHRDKVGPFMNGLHFCFGVGAFLSPIIIAQAVLMSGDITWAFWVLALLTLPAAAWLLYLPSPAIYTVSKDDPAGQVNYLLVALFAGFFFLYVGSEISFGSWIFTYITALNLAGETTARYLNSAFFGAITVGRLLAIPIAAYFRPRTILFSDFAGGLASVGLILLWPDSLTAVWLGVLGAGLSLASIFPTMLSLAERRMAMTGRVTSWLFAGGSVGAMLIPWLIGQLFEYLGPRSTMFTILIALSIAVGILVIIIFYSSTSSQKVSPRL